MRNMELQSFRTWLFCFVCCAILAPAAMAQRGRVSEADMLRRNEVWSELGLNDAQTAKLEELQKKSSPGRDFFEPYLKRIAETQSKEEQTKIRAEMTEAVTKARSLFRDNAAEVLDGSQKKKLRTMFLQSAGLRAFSDEKLAKDYGLSEEQTAKLAELSEQRRTASRELGFDASEEARQNFNDQWQEKFMAVLSPAQKERFEKESDAGSPPAEVAAQQQSPSGAAPGTPPQQMQAPPGEASVSSFGGGTAPGQQQRVESFSFNFRYAPWDQVLQMFADGAGLTLDLNQIPPGTFSHLDDKTYTARQALDIMNGYLLRKGYCMVQKDNFLIVLNIDNGIPPSLIPDVSVEDLLKVGKDQIVGENELANVTIPVDGMDTSRAAQEVEAMLGPQGSLVALTESQILIVTDVGANLRRVHGLLMTALSKAKPDALIFQSYFLRNIDAEEAEIAVMTQFGMRQNVTNVSAAAEERSRMQARIGGGRPPTPQSNSSSSEPAIQIAADLRLNSLHVTGTAKQHELVAKIVEALDVSEAPDGSPLKRGKSGTYLEVYRVQSADAREVTKTIAAMNMPGVNVVNEDGRAGTIHIMATQRQHEEVAALIRQLDGGGVSGSVSVIQLAQMDPLSAAATLRSLFYSDGDDAPTIETDLYGRRLIVRGSVEQIAQIKQVLLELGEDGSGNRQRGEGGLIRRFSLQGRNPEQFLRVLQQQWESQNQTTKINIVIPNDENPIRSRRTPDQIIDSPREDDVGQPAEPARNNQRQPGEPLSWKRPSKFGRWQVTTSPRLFDEESPKADEQNGQERADWNPGEKKPEVGEVNIQLFGDELLLSSTNEAALDRLEDLLDVLNQSLPMKPEYTVVYLKAADALEAADMLSQFFPSSSVASTSSAMSGGSSLLGSLGGSISDMGGSLMDMTGLSGLGVSASTLKIIPDVRTNSLFLTGPQSMIRDALAFLKVLDSNDIPESLKDMQPRQIAVKYADVNDVASLVRDVFKPYMEVQGQGRGQQQQNPLAMMFGGSNRGGNDAASQVRMTLGVDNQTSILTVNSSQEIFAEVESVVKQMDTAAQAAKPTVRSIQLKNADAALIQQVLTSLVPRVSISSSRTGTSAGSGSSGSTSSGGSQPKTQSNPQQEAINRAIQDRIRERLQGGGGARGPGGGGGGLFGGGRGPGGGGGGRGPGGGGRGR